MKIAIIGSTAYDLRMRRWQNDMRALGHDVKMPALDSIPGSELDLCKHNRDIIRWADEVHLIWDARSIGAIFDIGMAFGLGKKLVIIYMQPKRFTRFVQQYAESFE